MKQIPPPRLAGFVLIAVSILGLLAMSHHPTVSSQSIDQAFIEIGHERGINRAVHGFMIIVVALYYWAFCVFSAWLGPSRSSVGLAHTAVGFATATMTGAAIVSGFVVPEFASYVLAGDVAPADPRTLLSLLHSSNQALAKIGSVAYGAAILAWGIALCRADARFAKAFGWLGIVSGTTLSAVIVSGHLSLNVAGMTAIAVVLGAWASGVGIMLIKAR